MPNTATATPSSSFFYEYGSGGTRTDSDDRISTADTANGEASNLARHVGRRVSGDDAFEPEGPDWMICPHDGHQPYWHRLFKRFMPKMCGSHQCHACVVGNAFDVGAALAFAKPTVSFTLVGRINGERKNDTKAQKALDRAMVRRAPGWQSAMVIEANPDGTGFHVHGWGFADRAISDRAFTEAANACGFVVHTWVGRPRPHKGAGGIERITYGMKACRDRPAGATALWPEAIRHLELNGGQLMRFTHGFLRNGHTGERIGTLREAISQAKAWARGTAPGVRS